MLTQKKKNLNKKTKTISIHKNKQNKTKTRKNVGVKTMRGGSSKILRGLRGSMGSMRGSFSEPPKITRITKTFGLGVSPETVSKRMTAIKNPIFAPPIPSLDKLQALSEKRQAGVSLLQQYILKQAEKDPIMVNAKISAQKKFGSSYSNEQLQNIFNELKRLRTTSNSQSSQPQLPSEQAKINNVYTPPNLYNTTFSKTEQLAQSASPNVYSELIKPPSQKLQ